MINIYSILGLISIMYLNFDHNTNFDHKNLKLNIHSSDTSNTTPNYSQIKIIDINQLPFLKSSDNRLHIVLFLATDCPISQKYIHTLKMLKDNHNKDISFYGIIPKNYSENQIKQFKQEYKIDFDLIMDHDNKFASLFKATVTPEVFFFDSNGILYYDGAIDNWFYALGKNRRTVTEHYLKNAIHNVKNDELVKITHMAAIGCLIQLK